MNKYMLAAMVVVAGLGSARAADSIPSGSRQISDDELRIRGVFESSLPGTERKHALKFIFHPHFGDFTQRDELRIPMGLRYGLTERWEISGDLEAYFSHGLGDHSFFDEAGFSLLRFGTKYHWDTSPWDGWDTAAGIDYAMPVGNPPLDITDGLEHFAPFVTFAHRLNDLPNIRVFWGLGADIVRQSAIQGELKKNQLGDDSQRLTAGFVWDHGDLSYTFEASVASTRLTGELDRDLFTIQPGVIWRVPQRFTRNSRSQWLLGVGLRSSYGPDGMDYGASAKLRVNLDFKSWWRQVTHQQR